ncbi:MAG: DUF1080 domain-containing protein [Flammeovirgaceae bacterium]
MNMKAIRQLCSKTISLFLLSACITAACTNSSNKKGEPLFNGSDFTGWRFYKDRDSNSWEVVDGMLHCKPFDGNEKRADLITTQQFKNFELTWEWKLPPQGNSGVMFNVVEDFDEPYLSGPEYQLLDDAGYPGKVEEWQKTASNYGMHAANGAKPKPIGEWNSSKIVVNQNHVEHWLNGKKVVEYELGSADWKERKAASKWNDAAGYGASVQGYIAIQDHGSEVWLKNISLLKIE